MNSPYSVGGAKTWEGWGGVFVCWKDKGLPLMPGGGDFCRADTHTHTHLYDCDCVTFGLQYTVPEGLGRQSETYAREESVMLLSACTVVRTVLSWKWIPKFTGSASAFLITLDPFFPQIGGLIYFILFFFLWKMVRFVRLTSWRSWDLLNVDTEIPEPPTPTLTESQVRGLLIGQSAVEDMSIFTAFLCLKKLCFCFLAAVNK